MTVTLDRPPITPPPQPEPQRSNHRALIVLALTAAVAAVVFGLWMAVLPDRDSGGTAGSSSASVAAAVSNAELLQMWQSAEPPCDHPIGPSGAPLNKYNLVGGMYVTSGDVAAKLRGVSPRGDAAFVRDRMTELMVALMQTQSAMVDDDNVGTARIDAAGGDPATEKEVIADTQLSVSATRHAFDRYLMHMIAELEAGHDIPDRDLDSWFSISGTCPG